MKKPIHHLKLFLCLLFFILFTGSGYLFAQTPIQPPGEDSLKDVQILNASKRLTFQTINDTTKLTIIVGDVKLRQGNTLFYCDSCVINNNTNVFEAWGHVHINDSDTTDIYANHLHYIIRKKLANLDGNVKLTDGRAILTTPDLEYNMETNLGIYKNGGKVVNKNTVLTSQEGWYFSDLKDAYFKKNVIFKDPAYTIVTDSLLHNAETQTTRFISFTTITDSSGKVIKTKQGYINQKTGIAEFGQNPEIIDGDTRITAQSIKSNDSTGISIAEGNAVIVDNKNHNTIIAGLIIRNKKTDAFMATRKPLMIIQQDNDSIYVTADTLFSARLTDLYRARKLAAASAAAAAKAAQMAKDSIATLDTTKKGIKKPVLPDSSAKTIDTSSTKIKDTVSAKVEDSTISARIKDTVSAKTKDTLYVKKTGSDSSKIKDTVSVQPSFETVKNKDSVDRRTIPADTTLIPEPENPGDSSSVNSHDSVMVHTLKGIKRIAINENDSANRYFEAYHHVRIFNDSLQATCDSLFYSFKDSLFRLYQDPVVWAKESQITGDTILLFTKNKKADRLQAFENGFMVNKLDKEAYNQVKATRIDGYFRDGAMDSVRAKGSAECIYYIQDEDSAYTGINESKCDIIDVYFRNKELFKVIFRSSVTGTLWPLRQKSPSEMRLAHFRWLEERRPKTKFEMFE